MTDTNKPNVDDIKDHGVSDFHASSVSSAPMMEEAKQAPNQQRTLWGDAWYRLRRNRLALFALIWIGLISLAAITADLWVPQTFGDPRTINTQLAATQRLWPSSFAHPFGTDDLGRDVFGRVIYGARVSLVVGVFATAIAVFIGVILGALSGFYAKVIDAFIMRFTDIFLAFPYILFSILILAIVPPEARGVGPVILAIGLLGWPTFARLFRSSVLSVKENDYVAAGQALGASDARLMFRHILPNAIAPVVVYATMSIGGAILSEAALSFLGLGVQPPSISWGRMIDDGRAFLTIAPTVVLWPGLAILSTVLSFTLLGDGVRDALDVKMKD